MTGLSELKPYLNTQTDLIRQGMVGAARIRQKLGINQKSSVCIYDLCESQKITVRFYNINMEGMYMSGKNPTIHLSSQRPLVRRNFTCAHELGHHYFGHSLTIDELRNEHFIYDGRPPMEVLADSFAAFTLMPTIGLKEYFYKKGLNISTATALDFYTAACNFGVGQSTLVNHMAYSIKLISMRKREELGKITPKMIRGELLNRDCSENLVIVDEHFSGVTLDLEKESLVLLPSKVVVDAKMLMPDVKIETGRVFRPIKTGITRVYLPNTDWAIFVRISNYRYEGLARYRHLEDEVYE